MHVEGQELTEHVHEGKPLIGAGGGIHGDAEVAIIIGLFEWVGGMDEPQAPWHFERNTPVPLVADLRIMTALKLSWQQVKWSVGERVVQGQAVDHGLHSRQRSCHITCIEGTQLCIQFSLWDYSQTSS